MIRPPSPNVLPQPGPALIRLSRLELVQAPRGASGARGELMNFDAWIADIEAVVTFDVDAAVWRKYFDAGLKPRDAIDQHRVDEDV